MISIFDEEKIAKRRMKEIPSLRKKKRNSEALILLNDILPKLPDKKEALYQKGLILIDLANYDEAINCFNTILSRYPKFKQGWYQKGNCYYAKRKYEDANLCYKRALRIDKNSKEAINKNSVTLEHIERENLQIKEILEYEYINQKEITLFYLKNDLKYSLDDATHLIEILNAPGIYGKAEIPKLKAFIDKKLEDLNVTLYDLVIKYGLNLRKAKKVAQFLIEEIGVAVQRFPQKIDNQKQIREVKLIITERKDILKDNEEKYFPKITDAQKIGKKVVHLLASILSECCNVHIISQESDLGSDLDCELCEKIGGKKCRPTGKHFYVQCKGKEAINEETNYIRIPIKTKTINYWLCQSYPTFLIVVDDKSKRCYWIFPEEELYRKNKNCENQNSLTFKIPKLNTFGFELKELPVRMKAIILAGIHR